MLQEEIEKLTPIELIVLQKHVKLGKEHLEESLKEQEVGRLYELGELYKTTEKKVGNDLPEFVGSLTLALNTVFTTVLGGWMGLSGFLEYGQNAFPLLVPILFVCAFLGSLVGFLNYRSTKKNGERTIEKLKFKTIELNILKKLNNHREKEIREKIQAIHEYLRPFQIKGLEALELSAKDFNDHEVCLSWLGQVEHAVKDFRNHELLARSFFYELQEIRASVEEDLKEFQKRKNREAIRLVDKLGTSSLKAPIPSLRSWIRARLRFLITSFIPTLFGGFSSLFVYFGGAPKMAREMGRGDLFQFLSDLHTKHIEVGIALCITVYFAYSFLHLNMKMFQRDREVYKMDCLIANEEVKLELLDDRFLKIKRIEEVMKPMAHLHRAFKRIT